MLHMRDKLVGEVKKYYRRDERGIGVLKYKRLPSVRELAHKLCIPPELIVELVYNSMDELELVGYSAYVNEGKYLVAYVGPDFSC